jgi:hypothetical protein
MPAKSPAERSLISTIGAYAVHAKYGKEISQPARDASPGSDQYLGTRSRSRGRARSGRTSPPSLAREAGLLLSSRPSVGAGPASGEGGAVTDYSREDMSYAVRLANRGYDEYMIYRALTQKPKGRRQPGSVKYWRIWSERGKGAADDYARTTTRTHRSQVLGCFETADPLLRIPRPFLRRYSTTSTGTGGCRLGRIRGARS